MPGRRSPVLLLPQRPRYSRSGGCGDSCGRREASTQALATLEADSFGAKVGSSARESRILQQPHRDNVWHRIGAF
eukprot:7379240-Prymnesium_polylepis.1